MKYMHPPHKYLPTGDVMKYMYYMYPPKKKEKKKKKKKKNVMKFMYPPKKWCHALRAPYP